MTILGDARAAIFDRTSDDISQRHVNEGNLVCVCAASLSAPSSWLRQHLERALGKAGLNLPHQTAKALIADAVAASESSDASRRTALLADWHAKRLCEVGGGISMMQRVLTGELCLAGGYDARVREACMRVLGALKLPPRVLYDAEHELVGKLLDGLSKAGDKESSKSEDSEAVRRRSRARWLKIGGAGVVGGVALGLSGGLLAPALLPALGSVGLTGIAAGMSSASASMAIGGLFGAAGAGLGANAMANRTGAVQEFAFEKCIQTHGSRTSGSQGRAEITPKDKIFEVTIPIRDSDEKGGLLVWEFFTSQKIIMAVTAAVAFGVMTQDGSSTSKRQGDCCGSANASGGNNLEWALKEEIFDVGGIDRDGKAKTRRHTDALTLFKDNVTYVLRWRLCDGSMATEIRYRYAVVRPGQDMPVWLMSQEEKDSGLLRKAASTTIARALSCVVFIPGLLHPNATYTAPGVAADQFCTSDGAVPALAEHGIESYALRWETKQLWDLSNALTNMARKVALSSAAQNGAHVIAPALVGAVLLPLSLVSGIRTAIDNVWATTMSRARSAGHMLASELASRGFGKRPVTLAGYSCGALMIFTALEELAERDMPDIVHDVFLLGAPVSCDANRWRNVRGVVSGRLVNIYMAGDWYLEIMQRSTAIGGDTFGSVAGTGEVSVDGIDIENHNVSDLPCNYKVRHHSDYAAHASNIFLTVGLGDGERLRPWPTLSSPKKEQQESPSDRMITHTVSQPTFASGPCADESDLAPSPEVVVFTNRRLRRGHSEPPPQRKPFDED